MRFVISTLQSKIHHREQGQAMVEFALVLPFLVMLLCFIVDFGWMLSCKNDLTNLAGQAARYGAIQANKGEATVRSSVDTFVSNNGYNSRGEAKLEKVTYDEANGFVSVELKEDVSYLTGMTGVLTGHGTGETLEAVAAAPIDPYK